MIRSLSVVLLIWLGTGCAPSQEYEGRGAPDGWTGTETRWWRDGLDTSGVFRNLETLRDMGVTGSEAVYVDSQQFTRQSVAMQRRFEGLVRQSLIQLYRNQPELVDSLFEQHVMPTLKEALTAGPLRAQVDEQQRKAYKILRSHFREPQTALVLGQDVTVPYPDSLHYIGGRVRTQVYLDEAGKPQAVSLLEGVHPVLDDIAMKATTNMEWRPAYLYEKGRWVAIPSWARFSVSYSGGEEQQAEEP